MTAPLLAAEGVAVERGRRRIVDGVNLEVCAGETVALVGPNGSGKSTLLTALAGSLPLAAGRASLLGDDLHALSDLHRARRRAVLPQEHVVGFGFTCREVVRMGRFPWSRTPHMADDDAAVAEAMDRCGVADFARRGFRELSGGERARVALARVLAQRVPLLLLDEPTAALDMRFAELVMRVVRERAAAGDGALVVLHDLNLAAAYADRIVVLSGGGVVADAPPAEALDPELLTRVYGLPLRRDDLAGLTIRPDRSDLG